MSAPDVRLFTPEEAAPVLRMSRATIYRLVKRNKLPHHNIFGLGVRFTAQDIEDILALSARGRR